MGRNHGLKPWFCAHGFYMFASYKMLNIERNCIISKALSSGFSGKLLCLLSWRCKVQALLAPLCMHSNVARLFNHTLHVHMFTLHLAFSLRFLFQSYLQYASICMWSSPLSLVHFAPSRFRLMHTIFTP